MWQGGHLFLHRCLLHTLVSVSQRTVCTQKGWCHIWRMNVDSYVFVFRLNLRELGPLAAHMRWFVWLMAAAGTIYVFNYHEKWVHFKAGATSGCLFVIITCNSQDHGESLWANCAAALLLNVSFDYLMLKMITVMNRLFLKMWFDSPHCLSGVLFWFCRLGDVLRQVWRVFI